MLPKIPPEGKLRVTWEAQAAPPTTSKHLTREDGIFLDLHRAFLKPKARDAQKNAWISETTWRLVGDRVSARRDPARYHYLIWRLGRAIVERLKGDWRRRAEEAGKEVDKLLGSDPQIHRETCHHMKGWYRAAVDHAPPPC